MKTRSSVFALILFSSTLIFLFFLLRPQSRFLLTLVPPSDLYIPLVQSEISFNNNNSFRMTLKHKYVGTYFVGVNLKNAPDYGDSIVSNAVIDLQFNSKSKILFNDKYSNWSNRYGGHGIEHSGVILGFYKVPENLPMGVDVTASVTIETPDKELEEKYGPIKFYITRSVDQ